MKYYLGLLGLISLLVVACEPNHHQPNFRQAEIDSRLQMIEKNISVFPGLNKVEEVKNQFNQLLLLSKDVENPNAVCEMGNKTFNDYSNILNINPEALSYLAPKMDKYIMEDVILSNQMMILDALIHKEAPTLSITPLSAKE